MKKFNMSVKWQTFFKDTNINCEFLNLPRELKDFLNTELMDIITDYMPYDKTYSIEIKIKQK